MKGKLELRLIKFLVILLIVSFGLLTGFSFEKTLDVQLHDRYLILDALHILILLTITITCFYFLSIGMKELARKHKILKIISLLSTGLIGLGLVVILVLTTLLLPLNVSYDLNVLGTLLLILGLAVLFAARTIEIWKMSR